VEFILSNIGDDAQYLKDAFINKKRWYEFRESKASFFRKMNNAIISFNNYYGSISTI
jgi:hypothetical protein